MSNDHESQTHRPQDGWEAWTPHTADVAEIRLWKSGEPAGAGYLVRATFKVDGTGVTQAGTDALDVWRKFSRHVEEWIVANAQTLDALEAVPEAGTLYVKDSAKQR